MDPSPESLEALEEQIVGAGSHVAKALHLLAAVRLSRALFAAIQSQLAQTITLRTCPSEDALPDNAPANVWFRVRGDDRLFVGNGDNQPLTVLATSARGQEP